MRERETKDVSNKRLAVSSYWAYATQMGAMDLHERKQVVCGQPKKGAKPPRRDIHSAKNHVMSFDGADKIMKTQTWPSYSPQSAQTVYATTALLNLVNKSDAWEYIGRAWFAILFNMGSIIKHKKGKDYFLVLGDVGHVMVLAWKVERKSVGRSNFGCWLLGAGTVVNTTLNWINPLEVADYHVYPASPISPVHFFLACKKLSADIGVVFLGNGPPVTIMVHAANNCFFKMSLPMIKKISTFEKVEQPDPDLPSHLRNLIKKVLPGISEDRLKEILAMRSVVLPDPLEELLPPELVEELFTGDDHKMVQD